MLNLRELFAKQTTLNEYQWLMLARLTDRFNSLKDSLDLMEKMYPKATRLKEIKKLFSQGKDIRTILVNGKFEKKIAYYCRFTSLNNAINIVCEQKKKFRQSCGKFVSDMVYQMILLISTIIVFELFYRIVLPTMTINLEIESGETSKLLLIFKTINALKNLLICCFICCAGFIAYLYFTKKITHLWALLHRIKADRFIKIGATYFLALNLKILLENGISLKDCLDAIRLNANNQLSGLLAFHFNNCLEKGVDFETALDNEYFDEKFHSVCLWGLKNDDFDNSLNDYIQIVEAELKDGLKKITRMFQFVCYLFSAIIIVLAYEVLMIPLELLQEFEIFN